MVRLARTATAATGERALCLAGGVALNCVANGRLLREGVVDDLWVQPAAGDAGGALGAAMSVAVERGAGRPHVPAERDAMAGSLLGQVWTDEQIRAALDHHRAVYTVAVDDDELAEVVAHHLADGKVVGWFQGRMEFGPRALGARSILADPRDPRMQRQMNLKVKRRESFRPFAPAVLVERVHEYFDLNRPSPYMLVVAGIAEAQRVPTTPADAGTTGIDRLNVRRSTIPAVTHVDDSARVQTVSESDNRPFHHLLSAFDKITGCPVLVNTSLQRPRRADRQHPAGGVRLLHADRHRQPGHRPLRAREDRAAGLVRAYGLAPLDTARLTAANGARQRRKQAAPRQARRCGRPSTTWSSSRHRRWSDTGRPPYDKAH